MKGISGRKSARPPLLTAPYSARNGTALTAGPKWVHGWQVGKITSKITPATPRLFKSFNYRCSWSDGWSNQMLRLDEYGGGDEAEYNSWVILEKAAAVREEAGSS